MEIVRRMKGQVVDEVDMAKDSAPKVCEENDGYKEQE